MEPRNATLLALTCTLLVLVAPYANADRITSNPNTVTKCVVDGITTYSDKPCPDGIGELPLTGDNSVIVIASEKRARPVRNPHCDAAEAELHNIEALTRQGQPADMQAFLDARRQQKRNEQFRVRC
jgi:hypothetical protein